MVKPYQYAGVGVAVALLTGFGLIADEVVEGDTLTIDTSILMAFRAPGDPSSPIGPAWLQEAARDVTALGSFSLLTLLVVVVAAYLLLTGKVRTAWFLTLSVVSGATISTVLKSLFDRPRPSLEGVARTFTSSFPSGHATISAVVYLTLGAMLAELAPTLRLKVFYVSVAVWLTVVGGVSRVYLGVHYPTDVLAGWSLGTAWALICVTIAHYLRTRDTPSILTE